MSVRINPLQFVVGWLGFLCPTGENCFRLNWMKRLLNMDTQFLLETAEYLETSSNLTVSIEFDAGCNI